MKQRSFSPEDNEFYAWRIDHRGYTRRTIYSNGKFPALYAHRIIAERILGRVLAPSEIVVAA